MDPLGESLPEPGADRLKRITALRHAKYRRRFLLSFTEGVRSVRAAVESGAPIVEIVVSQSAIANLVTELRLDGLPVFGVPDRVFARLSDVGTDQGVLATFRIPTESLKVDAAGIRKVVVLDGVQDPGNVGTIVRTAAWYGVDGVVCGPGTADVFSPKTIRSTMGGVWSVRVYVENDLLVAVGALQKAGFSIQVATAEGSVDYEPADRCALVMGSEAHGVSDQIVALADGRATVRPAVGASHTGIDSLNVAVAAGILMERMFGGA